MVLSSFNISREFFFEKLPPLLSRGVEGLTLVTAARVPLIKFRYGAVAVDIVFASVALLVPPTAEQVRQDEFLLTVAAEDRFNVNGIRTVLEIRSRLPVPFEVYLCTLKAVKRWATKRGVYGNLFTFPNGAALAIMTARVCLMYSKSESSSQLLRLFFSFYTYWLAKHDRVMPIFITESLKAKPIHIPGMAPCWDPSRETCREELIPVLNPAYPYVNAAHTVGRCGFQHFYAELARANALLSPKANRSLASVLPRVWDAYCITDDFTHFVGVHVSCAHKAGHRCRQLFGVWKGLVESRLRMFIYALECFYDTRPLTHCCERATTPHHTDTQDGRHGSLHVIEGSFYIGLKSLPSSSWVGREAPPPDVAVVRRCFAELEYAIEDSIAAGKHSNHAFERVPKVMKGPWFTLHHVEDVDFPPELCSERGRDGCAESVVT